MPTQTVITAAVIDKEKLLADFGEYARVDLQLAKRTVYERKLHISHFLDAVGEIYSTSAVRKFLGQYVDRPYIYENYLKALRLLFRFLGKEEIVSSFQFPSDILKPPNVPNREQLTKFYSCVRDPRLKAVFLTLASSGLRISEVLSILPEDLDMSTGQITPNDVHTGESKRSWFSFVNSEALVAIKDYRSGPIIVGPRHRDGDSRIFPTDKATVESEFRGVSKISGVKITPKQLRSWFASEMAEIGMSDRYVDALCGRTPKSILARHYSDFKPEKLFRIYQKAGIRVLTVSKPAALETAMAIGKVQPENCTKRIMTLDMMKAAMVEMKQRIDSLVLEAIDAEKSKRAEEMKGLWSTIDFLKGQLRALEDKYTTAEFTQTSPA